MSESVIERAAQTAQDLLNQVEGLRGAWLLASQSHSPAMWEALTPGQRKNVIKEVKTKEDAYHAQKKILIASAPSLLQVLNQSDDHFDVRVQLEAVLYVAGVLPAQDDPLGRDISNGAQCRTMPKLETFIAYPSDHQGWKLLEDAITEVDNGL